jgi:PAS domain S-box-containing protein
MGGTRTTTDNALYKHLSQFKTMIEDSNDGILIADPNSKTFTYANKAISNMLGYTNEELLKLKVDDIHPEGDLPRVIDEFERQLKKEIITSYSLPVLKKDGNIFLADISSHLISINDKEYLMGMFRDISDKLQLEEKLCENTRRFKDIIELSNDLITEVDSNGNFTFVNSASQHFFGCKPEDCIGRNAFDFIHPEDKDYTKKKFNEWKETKTTTTTIENRQMNKNGDIFHLSWSINITYDETDTLKHVNGIARDITEKKRNETDLLLAKNLAEEGDKLKSAFLANMSHEIRTPMNAIIGFSQLLQNKELHDEKKDQYIQLINNNGRILLKLIDDIINLSKIEAGQIKLEYQEYCLNHILSDLGSFFQNEIKKTKKSNISITFQKGLCDEHSIILTDYVRLQQILNNLLSNAIKFTHNGTIEFGYTISESKKLHFFVKDTGIGMDQEQIEFIFERFRQGDDAVTRKYGGTGLGLSIAKGLVDLFGGVLKVDSEVNKGSNFYFEIPYKPVHKSTLKEHIKSSITEAPYWNEETVLVVDDQATMFFFLEESLSMHNLKVIHAKNGYEAIEFCKTNKKIKLVLMDIHMPGIDGFETTKRIKELLPELPIIAQTAFAMDEDKNKCVEAGCNGYIKKPIDMNELYSTISKYL